MPRRLPWLQSNRAPSTSPPPEPPKERFMDEGIDHDDKYRMVEDEFLTVAQQFTVHLHAAEYKRQEKLVKSRKAEAIDSISRPVVGRMPDQTRRKVESINRSKIQQNVIGDLLSKAGANNPKDSDDSDDAVDLPYVGTTLHGLMDSPRRKAASLGKIGSFTTTTRAAAGFKKPSTNLKSSQMSLPESPSAPRSGNARQIGPGSSTASDDEDDDDDLDAPILAPRLTAPKSEQSITKALSDGRSIIPTTKQMKPAGSLPAPNSSSSAKHEITAEASSSRTSTTAVTPALAAAKPRFSRVDFARRQRAKQELEDKKKLSVIPSFL
ncbi:hypothetical protein LSUE1_G007200 [Lachnellula suecica]|uniref:Uncharacterized protein n=1 Tax=Lachnellula suecica TaxID=602035 RepID=A0A8T9BXQ3_9HELO|nr:hypothetical protein LSUE1_G007200 [Lachnellula suecica]